MDFALALLVGLALGALGLFLAFRERLATQAPAMSIDDTVSQAVSAALTEALDNLDARSRRDREESIRLASDRVAEASSEQLGKRAEAIDTTLRSVQDALSARIQHMDTEIAKLRELNVEKFGSVDKAVSELAKRTGDLSNVLSSSQARGQWGERMAEDLLRTAGLIEGINYEKQDTIEGGGRPDYTFLLPPDRVLYMDVKFPLDSFTRYIEVVDPTAKVQMRTDFIKAVRDRVKELEKRDYAVVTARHSLDYVLLFVPNESINGFIHESDPTLIDWALQRKVVLCSPLTLYAFLAVVRQATDSFHTEETAAEILQMMSKFRKQWESYVKSLEKVKRGFDTMQTELDDLTVGKRFKGLNRETKKMDELRQRQNIPELESVTEIPEFDADFDDE
jgi:DNA recombination protein RmuC